MKAAITTSKNKSSRLGTVFALASHGVIQTTVPIAGTNVASKEATAPEDLTVEATSEPISLPAAEASPTKPEAKVQLAEAATQAPTISEGAPEFEASPDSHTESAEIITAQPDAVTGLGMSREVIAPSAEIITAQPDAVADVAVSQEDIAPSAGSDTVSKPESPYGCMFKFEDRSRAQVHSQSWTTGSAEVREAAEKFLQELQNAPEGSASDPQITFQVSDNGKVAEVTRRLSPEMRERFEKFVKEADLTKRFDETLKNIESMFQRVHARMYDILPRRAPTFFDSPFRVLESPLERVFENPFNGVFGNLYDGVFENPFESVRENPLDKFFGRSFGRRGGAFSWHPHCELIHGRTIQRSCGFSW